MKTNKFLLCTLFCVLVVGLSGCDGNAPEQNGSNGVLPGLFTVNAYGKQIQFSQGNLQYTQSTGTWSFAKNQYDMIGTDNVTGGSVLHDASNGDSKSGTALADKIDLFGWSGSTGSAKWGISTFTDNTDYSGDFVDWGQNIILNGGNKANQWRTLTYDEWDYLIYYRSNAGLLQGVARIKLNAAGSEYANGLILLPDNWTAPAGVFFKSGFASEWSVQACADHQTLTLDQWRKLEESGAVFLPVSGSRYGSSVSYVGFFGGYWSATPFGEYYAAYLDLRFYGAATVDGYRGLGLAVRLVQDVK